MSKKITTAATDRPDLKAMYSNLLHASENRLNAFTRQLDGTAGSGGVQAAGQGNGAGQGAGSGQPIGAGQGQGSGDGSCWN